MQTQKGTTLIELIVALCVIAILSLVGVPAFSEFISEHKQRSVAQSLQRALNHSRAMAIYHQQPVTLWNINGSWQGKLEMFLDTDGNGEKADEEAVLRTITTHSDINILGNRHLKKAVTYYPDGSARRPSGAFQTGTLTICRAGEPGITELVLSIGGRLRREYDASEVCEE
ncbi:GspH/FimT family pseudopilin [Spongiibacter sp. KMU-158]|uniref:Type II secretion system protein H n=1 Tax=Spongiibacter pelagi TaxID=2760804 RepID=A0A927C322_9GAMM|nr:GspH/FimT family pseudopilin [Spongiibacter pelagi]MBD2858716.1 GspH/FimT family pseudopilin [Spongiibacter pelagi]